MQSMYAPKQIAIELKVSTTTLRRYEEQGLIPDVPRTTSNHRYYKPIHFQAFITIRSLLNGYDIPIVYDVMRKIKNGEIHTALWLVNQQQYNIQTEKNRVEEILTVIKNTDFIQYKNAKITDSMSIGKVAEIAGVNTSAIRHWEQEGLIQSKRDKNNGYRIFTLSELRKILVIRSLRKTIYYIENMKDLLHDLDMQSYSKVDRSFQLALRNLNNQLIMQYKGITELIKYIDFYA